MRAVIYLTLSALAALVAASSPNAFKVPNGGYSFKTGSPTTLNWDPTTEGPVTLKLFSGTVMKPEDGVTIASGIPNSGSYKWTPPTDLVYKPDYTIEIVDDKHADKYNFSPRFAVSGATTASATAPTATSGTKSAPSAPGKTKTKTPSTATSKTHGTSGAPAANEAKKAGATENTDAASSSNSEAAITPTPDTNGAGITRVSTGMLALVFGAAAFM